MASRVAWVAIVGAIAAQARAAPELTLRWPEHASCPTREAIEARLREQLGRNLAIVERGLSADVRIRADERGYELVLSTAHGSERGERTFRAPSCREVSEAAVLLLALSLEERRTASAPEAPPPARQAPEKRPVGVGVLAAAKLDVGTLPGLGLGPELGLSLAFGRSRAELSGFYLPPSESEPRDDASVRVSLGGARLAYCRGLLGERLELAACAGAELGVASGRGLGLDGATTKRFVWRAAVLGARLTVRLGAGFALFAEPGLAIPLGRGQFLAVTSDAAPLELHTPSVVAARGSLGFHLTFR